MRATNPSRKYSRNFNSEMDSSPNDPPAKRHKPLSRTAIAVVSALAVSVGAFVFASEANASSRNTTSTTRLTAHEAHLAHLMHRQTIRASLNEQQRASLNAMSAEKRERINAKVRIISKERDDRLGDKIKPSTRSSAYYNDAIAKLKDKGNNRPETWRELAQCRSANRDSNTGDGLYGYFKFRESTWNQVGGQGVAYKKSYEEQLYRAMLARNTWGPERFGECANRVGLK